VRRWLYWTAVLAGVLLVGGGVTLAVRGYRQTGGPAGAVRGYFAALARGDSAGALAFGDVPDGPHTLLTADVLRSQQRIAPLRDFHVVATRQQGDAATVSVRYVLDYPGSPQTVNSSVPVHRTDGGWRLDGVAVPISLELDRALQRATIVGAGIPDGDTLAFPGAVPITFDTPYLQLDAAEDTVSFGRPPDLDVYVEVSPAGRKAVVQAVQRALDACLAGRGDPTCPLPDERYVPGSIRGRLAGRLADNLTITLDAGPAGLLDIKGEQPVEATSYRKLSFVNRPSAGHGTVVLDLSARAYAVAPLRLVWSQP